MAISECTTITDINGRELLEHGTVRFPIACYHDDLSLTAVPWHWHEELEMAVITEGSAIVAADSRKYHIKKGDGFFINSGVLHGAWQTGSVRCRFHSMAFHPRLVGGSMESVFWQDYVQPVLENSSLESLFLSRTVDWQKAALESLESVWQSCRLEQPGYEFEVRHALSQFIFLLSGHQGSAKVQPSSKALRDSTRIKLMLQYIQDHCAEDLNVLQIAHSASISESECLRCFHNTIGITPIQYLKQLRLQKAAELLRTSTQKIVDIGLQCGFQDMSYFARAFRTVHGCSPSEYRNRQGV